MTRLFRIQQDRLVETRRKPLDVEGKIERWVAEDLTLIGVDGLVIGRQVETDHGKRIDVLAIDRDGNLSIVELKRDRSPRDIVAQVLDYASWVCKPAAATDDLDDDALLAELGVDAAKDDIGELRYVRSAADKRAAEEIANRQKCDDFDRFKSLFVRVQQELENGIRQTRPFELKAEIKPGSWFIVGGQKAYVAEVGEVFANAQGRTDARLRVIFDNGTESNMLMRSLQRALHKDDAGRRITDPAAGPLFSGFQDDDDQASGTIYVLRSKSDHPLVAANRELVHKIGVTGMSVEQRIAGARLQPTFLMADVEIVATYSLFNIGRSKLEGVIHRVFAPARLDVEIKDRFGNPVVAREWFLVPIFVIDEVVERIKDGSITKYVYDPKAAALVQAEG